MINVDGTRAFFPGSKQLNLLAATYFMQKLSFCSIYLIWIYIQSRSATYFTLPILSCKCVRKAWG